MTRIRYEVSVHERSESLTAFVAATPRAVVPCLGHRPGRQPTDPPATGRLGREAARGYRQVLPRPRRLPG